MLKEHTKSHSICIFRHKHSYNSTFPALTTNKELNCPLFSHIKLYALFKSSPCMHRVGTLFRPLANSKPQVYKMTLDES